MIRERSWFLIMIYSLVVFALALFQTSVWAFLSPFSAQPNIWILLIVYMAMTRGFGTTVLSVYVFTLLLHTLTGMTFTVLLAWQLVVVSLVYFVRRRIYLPTLNYFLGLGLLEIAATFVALPLFSRMADPLPMSLFPWRELLINLGFLPIFGTLVFKIGRMVDVISPLPIAEVTES